MTDPKMSSTMSQSESSVLRVAVIGATGYGGLQTVRLIESHPNFKISFLGGERSAGKSWNTLFPFQRIAEDKIIQVPDPNAIADTSDFAILSLPNGVASTLVPDLLKRHVRVVDLSADYRYKSLAQWKEVYRAESLKYRRVDEDLCLNAIYGLPEWNQLEISKANLVAAPGCFPTASLIPLLPFLKQGLIECEGLIIDAKSGTSGGGRNPKENLLLAESSESITPYGVVGHRHTSEIEQMSAIVAGKPIQVQFTPHLVPMVRGLLSTVYSRLRDPGITAEDCRTVLETFYRNHECVDVLPVGIYPATKWARFTNKAILSVQVDNRTSRLILMSTIDNLLKGQAGQAIQSLNLMAGYDQIKGLPLNSFYP